MPRPRNRVRVPLEKEGDHCVSRQSRSSCNNFICSLLLSLGPWQIISKIRLYSQLVSELEQYNRIT